MEKNQWKKPKKRRQATKQRQHPHQERNQPHQAPPPNPSSSTHPHTRADPKRKDLGASQNRYNTLLNTKYDPPMGLKKFPLPIPLGNLLTPMMRVSQASSHPLKVPHQSNLLPLIPLLKNLFKGMRFLSSQRKENYLKSLRRRLKNIHPKAPL
jgi:hypothetical protein